jgi:hypothetical protein
MSKTKSWVITASGERAFSEVANDLKKAGFKVGQALEEIGVFTGDADDAAVKKLKKVRGVADVAPDEKIDIGPPGSPKTW